MLGELYIYVVLYLKIIKEIYSVVMHLYHGQKKENGKMLQIHLFLH